MLSASCYTVVIWLISFIMALWVVFRLHCYNLVSLNLSLLLHIDIILLLLQILLSGFTAICALSIGTCGIFLGYSCT